MQQKQESRTPPTVYVMICCLFTFSFEKKKIPGIETSKSGSSPGGQADPSPQSCGVKGLRLRALLRGFSLLKWSRGRHCFHFCYWNVSSGSWRWHPGDKCNLLATAASGLRCSSSGIKMTMKDPNDYMLGNLHQTVLSKIHDCISNGSSTRAHTHARPFQQQLGSPFVSSPCFGMQLNDKIPPVNARPMTSLVK